MTEYPRYPSYAIFDEAARRAGPIGPTKNEWTWANVREGLIWSNDNCEEIAKGWIIKGETIEDLASKLNMSSDVLNVTLKGWNDSCSAGNDLMFGRDPATMEPIMGPPYYAFPLLPRVVNTLGGPRKNVKSQVVRPDGTVINRLYAAGELSSVFGFLYQGGSNLGIDCLVIGKISGLNAAAEKPWDKET